MKKIIFSDMDGCFINAAQTKFSVIRELFVSLDEKNIDVFLCTGKTAHEVMHLNKNLHLKGPFIIENGNGILFKERPAALSTDDFSFISIENYYLLQRANQRPNKHLLETLCGPDALLTNMSELHLAELTGITP